MAKPIIKTITPFDATLNASIEFVWSGDRAYGNRCIISVADSLSPVFDDVSKPNFIHSHKIPAGTLKNGTTYVVQISVINSEGVESPLSDKMYFYCIKSPTYGFRDLDPTKRNEINNASYTATIDYVQDDWEDIRSYRFHLYDAAKTSIIETDEFYDIDNIQYTYKGFDTSTTYYLRWTGVTTHGIQLDTGYIEIFVFYRNPSTYVNIYATNDPLRGYIKYNTNIKIIQYNGTETFTYDKGRIILTDKTLYYDEGFKIQGDFTLKIKGFDMWKNAEIFKAKDSQGQTFNITSHIYNDGISDFVKFKLTVPDILTNYIIYTKSLVFEPEDMVTLVVRRINNVWGIYAFITIGEYEVERVDTFYSDTKPDDKVVDLNDYWIENGEEEIVKISYDNQVIYKEEAEPVDAQVHELWIGGSALGESQVVLNSNDGQYETIMIADNNDDSISKAIKQIKEEE